MDPGVVEHDERWVTAFRIEADAVGSVLGDVLVTGVEHVGSTSVPGLAAKPIVDMMAGVGSLEAADAARAALAARGYVPHRHRPEARLFVRADPTTGIDTHHLHLTVPGSALWVERLAFRDALRENPDLVTRYAAWKREHATGNPQRAYNTVKTSFVAEALAARGIKLLPDEDRLSPPG